MRTTAVVCLLLAFPIDLQPAFGQGPLTPPGPPAPTMKSLDQLDGKLDQLGAKADQHAGKLDQVEAKADKRIAVSAATTPGNATYEFIISQPGSYYLNANVDASKPSGISITAAGVTLDLNGFRVARASGSGGAAIRLESTAHNAVVRNGIITGWSVGIIGNGASAGSLARLTVSNCSGNGMTLVNSTGWQIDHCISHDNSGDGISAEFLTGSRISNSNAFNNGGVGMSIGGGSLIVDCTATANRGLYGFLAGGGCKILRSTAHANVGTSSSVAGILAAAGSAVIDCTATNNQSTGTSTASANGVGIRIDSGVVRNCRAEGNTADGIRAESGSIIIGNSAVNNGSGGDGAGVHVTGNRNRIEGNDVSGNDRGIDVDVGGNMVLRNSASNNTFNYAITANNKVGLIVTPANSGNINGDNGGTSITDPWANFVY